MVLWLCLVIAMNVLAVAAIVVSVSDRRGRLRMTGRSDRQNPSEQR